MFKTETIPMEGCVHLVCRGAHLPATDDFAAAVEWISSAAVNRETP